MRSCFLFTAFWTLLLAGCCANNVCDCHDYREDALYLRFRVGDGRANSFTARELDTVSVLRYNRDSVDYPRSSHDSITVTNLATEALVLDNAAPFTAVTDRKLNAFSFAILLPRSTRRYTVRGIRLRGSFEGEGCCTCYQNTGKTATVTSFLNDRPLRSDSYDATASERRVVEFELTKQ